MFGTWQPFIIWNIVEVKLWLLAAANCIQAKLKAIIGEDARGIKQVSAE